MSAAVRSLLVALGLAALLAGCGGGGAGNGSEQIPTPDSHRRRRAANHRASGD